MSPEQLTKELSQFSFIHAMQALHVLHNAQLPMQFILPHSEKVPKQVEHSFENPSLSFMHFLTQPDSPQQDVPQEFKASFETFFLLFQVSLSFKLHKLPSEKCQLHILNLYVNICT